MSACVTWMVSVGLIGSLVLCPVYGGSGPFTLVAPGLGPTELHFRAPLKQDRFRRSADPEQIEAKPGEDVPLQCRGSKDDNIVMLRWVRPDLRSEGYVFYFADNSINEKYQHESFHGRVDLSDPEMKDGDFSVILKNVRISDTGSYECYVGTKGTKPKLINNISLKVEYPGHGHVGLTVVGILLLVAAVVGFMIYRKRSRPTDQNPNPPPEQTPMNPKGTGSDQLGSGPAAVRDQSNTISPET